VEAERALIGAGALRERTSAAVSLAKIRVPHAPMDRMPYTAATRTLNAAVARSPGATQRRPS
jgi:hypothetical protein